MIASYDAEGARETGELDDIVAFAAELCAAPVALVSLVEEEYQQFIAQTGFGPERTPRSESFCAHAMHGQDVMQVPDARRDARFASNPLVTGEPHIRFYAGAPLVSIEGVPLGTLCVIDTTPRPDGLTPLQHRGLRILASAAMGRLGDRRKAREHDAADLAARGAMEASERKFRTLADTMPQMVWSTLPDGFHDYYNARWYAFTGVPAGSTDGEAWNGMFHPDDRERAWAAWRHSLATGEPYSIEYRLRHLDGTYRWVLGRALPMRNSDGDIARWFGTCTDIHEQKLASEEREVISQELSHRIKNIFAVVAGLIAFAARHHPEFAPIATDLRHRITALGRAHDFVRPHSARSQPEARQDSLTGLLAGLFAPYQPGTGTRIAVTGDDITIDDRSATPLALLFHELATNATKYGALRNDDGRVEVAIGQDREHLTLAWTETGGPPLSHAPQTNGFGSRLIAMSVVRQLGGTIARDWRREGLAMTITVPLAALRRA